MSNIKNYIHGTSNQILDYFNLLSEEVKQKALDRQSICNQCEELNKEEEKCNKCGCAFPGLTYAMNKKCPLSKW